MLIRLQSLPPTFYSLLPTFVTFIEYWLCKHIPPFLGIFFIFAPLLRFLTTSANPACSQSSGNCACCYSLSSQRLAVIELSQALAGTTSAKTIPWTETDYLQLLHTASSPCIVFGRSATGCDASSYSISTDHHLYRPSVKTVDQSNRL